MISGVGVILGEPKEYPRKALSLSVCIIIFLVF